MTPIPESFKGPLREHPATHKPYMLIARLAVRCQIFLHERLFGRYYTRQYFERLFAARRDPWRYTSDPIAEERRALILSRLSRPRCRRLLEIGAGEGWMTAELAKRSETLFAVDISEVALRRARAQCSNMPSVRFVTTDLLHSCLTGKFEGIVCAGVLVFVPEVSQHRVRDHLVSLLSPGGELLLEHTREASPGEVAGRLIHAMYHQHPSLELVSHEERDCYAISVFRKMGRP